ncbi:MAG: protein kinase [Methanobacteriaceae archaeon]|nr:protein kinase [Methanobacteriaceae archaeon]
MKCYLHISLNHLGILILFFLLIFFNIFLSLNPVSAEDNNIKVLFDEVNPTYGKFNTIHNVGTYGSSGFSTLLETNGYSVSKLTDRPITSDKLKGYNVLIIMGEYRNYTDEEVMVIKDFVNNGGGLLLFGTNWGDMDGDESFAFNKIARSFGVDFANNEIVTNDQNYIFFSNIVEINDLKPSSITANVQNFYYMMGTYIKNPGPSNVVAYTDSYTWGDIGYTAAEGYTMSNFKKDNTERSGPLPVVSQMEYGKGKVVFMGSSLSFINAMFYRSNAWKLGLNSVNWLSNKPTPTTYKPAGLFSFNLIAFQILLMIIFTVVVISGLFWKIKRDKRSERMQYLKSMKNWKFNALIVINILFVFLAGLLFIPINFFLYDIILYSTYDPSLGYTLIITGALFLFFMLVILFNLITRHRILVNYSYYNIVIVLLCSGFIFILGDLFGFPQMEIFTFGSLILLIPLAVNLWFDKNYGSDLIIEGKEFDRLKKLSTKSLPYELQPFYTEAAYIGEGGFGKVFKGINKEGKEVAIKIPKSFDNRAERTFITEVSNWSHLKHPNIVELYDYKILPIPYLETEFCEGNIEKGMKTLQESVSIIYDIAKGLAHAHSQNIIHGDVKISNILEKNGVYKISDWGLSKLKADDSVTLSGATPSYAAPEQISQEFGKADERTDIYQLGAVFYELITGRLPFEGNISQIYSSILTTEPTHPLEINPNAKPVDEIIMKCLNKNKNTRYSSMEELLKELEAYRKSDETILFEDNDDDQ